MDSRNNADIDVLVLDLTLDLDGLFSRADEITSKAIYNDDDE